MSVRILHALAFVFLFAREGWAQKEHAMWYFGHRAALDFNSGTPVPVTGSSLSTTEGSASIADRRTGQLLFYTDGDTVWGKNHQPIANGSGLWGNKSTSQSALIVPAPGDTNRYYIFTVAAAAGTNGAAYSVVDISQNVGIGAVILKNQPLLTPVTEKLCAVKHPNGVDFWVLIHQWNSNAFYAYLVNASGVQPPIISSVGTIHQDIPGGWNINYEALGYMKFSPDGKRLALAICNNLNKIEIFDFDQLTGTVSNPVSDNIPQPNSFVGPYGVCFSPDNSRLYAGVVSAISSHPSIVYQYDLSSGNAAQILSSRTVVSSQVDYGIGALQIGPDGKIYVAKTNWNNPLPSGSDYLDVINCPNALGLSCGYTANALYLGGAGVNQSTLGFPNFVESFLAPSAVNYTATLTYFNPCSGNQQITFSDSTLTGPVGFAWDFGDPGSGSFNTSTLPHVTHSFTSGGSYQVSLIMTTACKSDTFRRTITVNVSNTGLSISGPDTLCAGATAVLSVTGPGPVQWQHSNTSGSYTDIPGATTPSLSDTPSQTSYYRVYIPGGNCADTSQPFRLVVNSLQAPSLDTADMTVCSGDSSVICAPDTFVSYQWNNGSAASCIGAKLAGGYWVSVTAANGCTAVSNRVSLSIYPVSSVSIIRQGDTLSSFGAVSYQWLLDGVEIPGATGPVYVASSPGTYSVRITDTYGCNSTSTGVIITGINEYTGRNAFTASVQSERGVLRIKLDEIIAGGIDYTVYDVLGRPLFSDMVSMAIFDVNISPLSSGIYVFRMGNRSYKFFKP